MLRNYDHKELSRTVTSDLPILKEIFVTQKEHLEFSNKLYAHIDDTAADTQKYITEQLKILTVKIAEPHVYSFTWVTIGKLIVAGVTIFSAVALAWKALGL